MTKEEKTRVSELRSQGLSVKDIAQKTGMPLNTVKSFCYRNPRAERGSMPPMRKRDPADTGSAPEKLLFGLLPPQMVELPSGAGQPDDKNACLRSMRTEL